MNSNENETEPPRQAIACHPSKLEGNCVVSVFYLHPCGGNSIHPVRLSPATPPVLEGNCVVSTPNYPSVGHHFIPTQIWGGGIRRMTGWLEIFHPCVAHQTIYNL